MGFLRIFWKNNVQEAYLLKISISGQIVSEIVAQLCLEISIQTLLNFFGSTPQKIKRVFMEFFEYNRLTSHRQFAPKCSFLVSRPLGHFSFRISWQIPSFQKFHLYDVITLVLYAHLLKQGSKRDTHTFKKEVHMRSLVNKKSDWVMVYCDLWNQLKSIFLMVRKMIKSKLCFW